MRISDCDDLFLISHQRRTSDVPNVDNQSRKTLVWRPGFRRPMMKRTIKLGECGESEARVFQNGCINNVLMVGRCSNKVKRYTL